MTLPVRTKLFLVILALLAATGLSIRLAKPLQIETAPPVQELPVTAGAWTGRSILFCQNDQCNQAWTPDSSRYEGGQPLCQICATKLDTWSLGERHSLAATTLLIHRQYTNAAGSIVTMALVISPPNMNSIHRPQTCILGQGYRIVRQEEIAVPLPDHPPLSLTLLELSHLTRDPNGHTREIHSFLAYWFMDQRRQTPSHTRLTAHLMWDRLAHGRISRWAYMTLASERNVSREKFIEQVNDLVGAAFPELR
jgi:hypothetical protein